MKHLRKLYEAFLFWKLKTEHVLGIRFIFWIERKMDLLRWRVGTRQVFAEGYEYGERIVFYTSPYNQPDLQYSKVTATIIGGRFKPEIGIRIMAREDGTGTIWDVREDHILERHLEKLDEAKPE